MRLDPAGARLRRHFGLEEQQRAPRGDLRPRLRGLSQFNRSGAGGSKVFRFSSWVAENAWRNEIRITAQCPDLRIHDLRHEALSRMSARGADLKTLMWQSGNKTVAVLMRYLNPTPAEQRWRLFPDDAIVGGGPPGFRYSPAVKPSLQRFGARLSICQL